MNDQKEKDRLTMFEDDMRKIQSNEELVNKVVAKTFPKKSNWIKRNLGPNRKQRRAIAARKRHAD